MKFASSSRTGLTYKQQRPISTAEISAPNQHPEEPPTRQDTLSPQEPSPAMSSSPEPSFLDQLYQAILLVGMKLESRVSSKYLSRTASKFSSAMQVLKTAGFNRSSIMLAPGVSREEEDMVGFYRDSVIEDLCIIGTVFIKGKSFISLRLGRA